MRVSAINDQSIDLNIKSKVAFGGRLWFAYCICSSIVLVEAHAAMAEINLIGSPS